MECPIVSIGVQTIARKPTQESVDAERSIRIEIKMAHVIVKKSALRTHSK
jgi:hypothetical protein